MPIWQILTIAPLGYCDAAENLTGSRTKSAPDGGGANPRCRAFAKNRSRWSLDLFWYCDAAENLTGSRTKSAPDGG